tara:strand:- start:911 stop:4000 length:3090 start_codon:yes stop_codon:yes gene_type:complete
MLLPLICSAQADIAVTINGSEIASGASIDFGTITTGARITNVFYIENVGDATLNFDATSAFAFSGTDASIFDSDADLNSVTLGAGEFTVIDFTIESSSTGSKNATITINTDDSDESTFTVNLAVETIDITSCVGASMDMETPYLGGLQRMEAFVSSDPVGVSYYEAPAGWTPVYSLLGALLGADSIDISITTDARSGSGALKLTNGDDSGADVITQIPCSNYPETFSGYYKYSGSLYVSMIVISTGGDDDENRTSNNTDTLLIESEESSYTFFEMDIPYDAQSVDTLTISLIAGNSVGGNTIFIFDDLSINQGAGGIGAPFTPNPIEISNITSSSFDVTWEAPNDHGATISSYTLEEKVGDGSYATVYTGTDLTFSRSSGTTGETYYYKVKATNAEGDSPYSEEKSITLMEVPDNTITIEDGEVKDCLAYFTDTGGESSNYSSSENITFTVKPETVGKKVSISFESFDLETNFDYLKIYNGATSASSLLATLTGTSLPSDYTSTAPGGELTFVFTSDGSITRAGWKATLSCIDGANTSWTGTSWDNGTPSSSITALIEGDYNGDGFVCENLVISSSNAMTFTGTLEVKSGISNEGSLVVSSGNSLITYPTGEVDDNIVIQRNTRYSDGKYSFVGTPVEFNEDIVGSDLGGHVYRYDEEASTDVNSLARWISAASDVLVPGKGYTQASQQLIEFTGRPNADTVTYSASFTNDGWHLVSNPYAAAISLSDFIDLNSTTTDAIYIWDDNGSDTGRGSSSDYIVANKSGATDNSGTNNESRWNGYIGSMQGFFIQMDGSSGEIVFAETMRVSGENGDGNYFRQLSQSFPKVRVNLTHTEGLFKQALVVWNNEVEDEQISDGYDARVFSNSADYAVSTRKADTNLAIQTITTNKYSIPISYSVKESGEYTLQLDHNEAQMQELWLHDLVTDELVDARYGYSFKTEAGRFDNRFVLTKELKILGEQTKEIKVYAAEKTLFIYIGDSKQRDFEMYSVSGEKVFNTSLSESARIHLSLPAGIYLVTTGKQSYKVLIK